MKLLPKIYKKYTQAGPNYQYYPTKLGFHDPIKNADIIDKLVGLKGRKCNLQLYFPYCRDPDCHSTNYQIKLEQDSQLSQYIEFIEKEILIYKKYFNKIKIIEIHLSGNEISLLEPTQLSQLLNFIVESFAVNLKDVNLSLDINTRLFDIKKFESLKKIGVNRLRISTLNFDYQLQLAANKNQSYQHVEQLIRAAKKTNFKSTQIELFYGLPNESYEGMKNTINRLIALNCEHICLSHYFHRPFIFKLQKMLNRAHLATDDENYLIFKMCVDTLMSAGYKHLGMNCFVSSDSELYTEPENKALSYNHTGYTLNTINNVVSLGTASISKVDGFFYQNFIDIDDYSESLNKGCIPAAKGCDLNSDHFFRKNIIKSLIINYRYDIDQSSENQLNMLDYIKDTCAYLFDMEKDELVKLSEQSIEVTELGKYFLKNICALFDLNMRELISYDIDE